jgi:hypothetical protein
MTDDNNPGSWVQRTGITYPASLVEQLHRPVLALD